jgi:hypothetical protein
VHDRTARDRRRGTERRHDGTAVRRASPVWTHEAT